jgi:hypothetical protein
VPRIVTWLSFFGSALISVASPASGRAGDAGTAPATSVSARDQNAAAAVAWIVALRDRNADTLTRAARFPFMLRDTGESGHCKNRTAAAVDKLKETLACLLKDDLLHEDLTGWPRFKAKPMAKKDLPSWTRRWAKELPADAIPYSVRIQGSGSMQSFVLLMVDGGVRGVWRATGFDAG